MQKHQGRARKTSTGSFPRRGASPELEGQSRNNARLPQGPGTAPAPAGRARQDFVSGCVWGGRRLRFVTGPLRKGGSVPRGSPAPRAVGMWEGHPEVPPALTEVLPGCSQPQASLCPSSGTQAPGRGCVWGFTARGFHRSVRFTEGVGGREISREIKVHFNREQRTDKSLPGCEEGGKPTALRAVSVSQGCGAWRGQQAALHTPAVLEIRDGNCTLPQSIKPPAPHPAPLGAQPDLLCWR